MVLNILFSATSAISIIFIVVFWLTPSLNQIELNESLDCQFDEKIISVEYSCLKRCYCEESFLNISCYDTIAFYEQIPPVNCVDKNCPPNLFNLTECGNGYGRCYGSDPFENQLCILECPFHYTLTQNFSYFLNGERHNGVDYWYYDSEKQVFKYYDSKVYCHYDGNVYLSFSSKKISIAWSIVFLVLSAIIFLISSISLVWGQFKKKYEKIPSSAPAITSYYSVNESPPKYDSPI